MNKLTCLLLVACLIGIVLHTIDTSFRQGQRDHDEMAWFTGSPSENQPRTQKTTTSTTPKPCQCGKYEGHFCGQRANGQPGAYLKYNCKPGVRYDCYGSQNETPRLRYSRKCKLCKQNKLDVVGYDDCDWKLEENTN